MKRELGCGGYNCPPHGPSLKRVVCCEGWELGEGMECMGTNEPLPNRRWYTRGYVGIKILQFFRPIGRNDLMSLAAEKETSR